MTRWMALAIAVPFACIAGPAFADGTAVAVPVGDWVGILADLSAVALTGVAIFALRMLPAPIYRFLMMVRAEQLIARAVDFGVQSVAGAARGRTLTVDLGNEVLASATRYAVDAADDLVQWLGGAEEVRWKILARLDVEPDAVAAFSEDGKLVGLKSSRSR